MGIPATLRDRLHRRLVIPFVGAGVSRAVMRKDDPRKPLFPSWNELLRAAADHLELEGKPSDASFVRSSLGLDPPKYLDAAGHARESLGPLWYDFLKQQLGHKHEMADEGSLALAQAVWNLGSKLVITTNYDHVLRWNAPSPADLQHWDIEAPAEQARALQEGGVSHPTVWHLHGHIGNAANIILTPNGYDLLYPPNGTEAKYKAALDTLRQFLTTRSFLFVGYSMDDIRLVETVRKIHDIFSGANGPHYVLAAEKERERIGSSIDEVEVIAFSDFGQPLLDLMQELRGAAEEKPSTDTAPLASVSTPPKVADYDPRKRVFHVPYRQKGDQVVGREKALNDLHQQLTAGRRTTIGHAASFDGIGGLGKTQLAIEYAYRYGDEYPNGVIWLNADQDIGAQLIQVAEKARWVAPESEHKPKYDIALHRLRSYSECLIIFDNLEELDAIQDYLPEPQAEPHVLVTSRKAHTSFVPVDLSPLDLNDSLKLLVQEAGRAPDSESEQQAASGIAQDLAGLPLALELAGAYVKYLPSVTWSEYHILLRGDLEKALSVKELDSFTKHDRDLFATLTVDEKILKDEPFLVEILDLLTWSARASMSRSLIGMLAAVTDDSDLTSPLGLGVRLRLLKKLPDSDRYELHPLVLEVRRKQYPITERAEWAGRSLPETGGLVRRQTRGFH